MFQNVSPIKRKGFVLFVLLAVCLVAVYVKCDAEEQPKKVSIRWLYPPEYYQGTNFSEGLVWVKEQVDNPHVIEYENGPEKMMIVDAPWTLLDDKGNVLKRGFEAKDIGEYQAGFAGFTLSESWETSGMVDRSGEVVFHDGKRGVSQPRDGSGLFAKRGEGNLYGFIDIKGKWIIPPRYENAKWFQEGLCAVEKDGKWGFIDAAGRTAIEFKFSDVYSSGFTNGVCHIRMYEKASDIDGKSGVIDKRGRWVSEPINSYVFLSCRTQGNLIGALRDGKVGFLDRKGNWVISPRYPLFEPNDRRSELYEFYENGVAAIPLEGQEIDYEDSDPKVEYGIIDESGRLVAKTGNSPAYFRGRFAVIYSEKWETMLIDKEGKKYLLPDSVQGHVWVTATDGNIFTAINWKESGDKERVGYFVVDE